MEILAIISTIFSWSIYVCMYVCMYVFGGIVVWTQGLTLAKQVL
jgi:hypothetical protein